MNSTSCKKRCGAIALMTAFALLIMLGMIACAFDIGWILMTKTQLHAAADASALAGGTELLDGLGFNAEKTPAEVDAASRPVAVAYAAGHRAGEQPAAYADAQRDIQFGNAAFNAATGAWDQSIGDVPYNMVRVTLHRDIPGSPHGDVSLPLFVAPVFGNDTSDTVVSAAATIQPAAGFYIEPGSNDTANVAPFALRKPFWDRFLEAQDHYPSNPTALDPENIETYTDSNGDPLYGHYYQDNQGNDVWVQDFYNNYGFNEGTGTVGAPGSDTVLELNLYPTTQDGNGNSPGNQPGNFGTIDIGTESNSTAELVRQILHGINESDLSHYSGNEIVLDPDSPLLETGDTGISGGINSALQQIVGECRAVALFTNVVEQGNNATYTLVEWVGVRIMAVDLTGNNKYLFIEPCVMMDGNAIPDTDDEVGEDTTVFTPLILIE